MKLTLIILFLFFYELIMVFNGKKTWECGKIFFFRIKNVLMLKNMKCVECLILAFDSQFVHL